MSDTKSSGFSWFLAGLGIGSLIGVLYAPKSGAETREELVAGALGKTEYLKQRASEVGDQVGQYVDQAKTQATQYVGQAKEQANQYVGQAKDYVAASQDKLTDVVNQGKNLVNEHTTKAAAAYEAGKQAYVETTVPPVAPTSEPA